MTFEELQKANKSIMTMEISHKDKQGNVITKDYAEVNQRIKVFRMLFPEGCIETDMLSNDGNICVFRAIVSNAGNILGTGTAFEQKDSTFINKTSYIENCETSAVGRALAMCGIGIDVSVASFEEVTNAIENQKSTPTKKEEPVAEAELKTKIMAYVNRHQMSKENIEKICKAYKVASLAQMTAQQCQHYINALEKRGGKIDE